ncbi:MAG: HlyD family efflux transporter periplasmic adaptor subunit [Gemmatimonadota bacterium]|nr:HlyD family efflux transporter periplasmic adaptor subunit [Gemmatimonadota bacterium]
MGLGIAAVVGVTIALTKLKPAPPSVEGATLWRDTVRRGEMVRAVRGPGTLVPEHIRLVSALTAGRVENVAMRAGTAVTPSTILLDMSNPDVQLQVLEAQRTESDAENTLVTLRTNLETTRLTLQQQYNEAKRNADVADGLSKEKLMSDVDVKNARDRAADLAARLKVTTDASKEQIALAEQNIRRLKDILQFQQNRMESMHVRAGENGVLTEMNLELGQWVVPGQLIAKVSQPGRLKAVIRIPETQIKDIVLGLPAQIDTRNGIIEGRVIRIDPAATAGTFGVDVSLEGELPKGARPDLSVDGTITIERLKDVLFVGRPAYGQAESTVGIFRQTPDGKEAERVNTKLGRSSVNTIEILSGLKQGDVVIVSDMSAWDQFERVRIK